jgi:hypothetical protein
MSTTAISQQTSLPPESEEAGDPSSRSPSIVQITMLAIVALILAISLFFLGVFLLARFRRKKEIEQDISLNSNSSSDRSSGNHLILFVIDSFYRYEAPIFSPLSKLLPPAKPCEQRRVSFSSPPPPPSPQPKSVLRYDIESVSLDMLVQCVELGNENARKELARYFFLFMV